MKGKKLVFAVILSLIVCLLLVPSAFAEENTTENNSDFVDVDNDITFDDGDNGGSNNDSQNNESTDYSDDSGDDNSENNDSSSKDKEQSGENTSDSDTNKNENEGGNSDLGDNSDKDKNTNGEDESTDDDDTTDDASNDENGENNDANEDGEDESNSENDTDSSSNPNPDSGAYQSQSEKKSTFMVEFSYNGTSHKLDNLTGNEQFDFAEILTALGIPVNSIDTVKSGNEELFTAENGENGWKFITKKAFSTKETMTVTVDGVEYVLSVLDDAEYSTATDLQNAINNAGDNAKFKLGDNIVGDIIIPEGKTIIIDLNGHTITNDGKSHTIFNKGTLTINDSNGKGGVYATGSYNATIANLGEMTINAGTYSHASWYTVKNLGKMTINGGVFNNSNSGNAMLVNGWYDKSNSDKSYWCELNDLYIDYTEGKTATLIINGGSFTGLIKNDDCGKLEIVNGTFTNNNTGDHRCIMNSSVADETVISGGSFYSKDYVVEARKGITVNGGIFEATNGVFYVTKVNAKLTINNGSFIAPKLYTGNSKGQTAGTVHGGLYSAETIKNYVDEYSVITKCGDMYAVNESGYEFAKSGNSVEIVKAPANSEIDDVPAGVTVVNNSGNTIIVNGVEVKSGETYTTVAPASTISYTEAPMIKYWVVEGKDQEWTKNSGESLMFTLNSEDVIKVLIDGVEVEFTVENGEIVISAEVLEALEAGEYVIEFVFADGSCKTDIFVKQ